MLEKYTIMGRNISLLLFITLLLGCFQEKKEKDNIIMNYENEILNTEYLDVKNGLKDTLENIYSEKGADSVISWVKNNLIIDKLILKRNAADDKLYFYRIYDYQIESVDENNNLSGEIIIPYSKVRDESKEYVFMVLSFPYPYYEKNFRITIWKHKHFKKEFSEVSS